MNETDPLLAQKITRSGSVFDDNTMQEARRASLASLRSASLRQNAADNDGFQGSSAVDDGTDAEDMSVMSPRKARVMVATLFVGSFLAALDMTVVTTLLPSIASDLEASSQMSWIATSYLLSCSSFQPMYGKLSNVLGRRELLVASNLFFAVGCFLCGSRFSCNIWTLSIARFIAGIGGGGMSTLMTIAVSDIIPLRQRGLYQGIGNIFFSLGSASGSILGAALQKTVGWRWAFLVQVPVALFSAALVYRVLILPDHSPGRGVVWLEMKEKGHFDWNRIPQMIDFLGCASLVSTMLILMIGITFLDHPEALGITSWLALLVLLVLAAAIFVRTELTVDNPVVPLRLVMRNRTVLSSSFTNWFCTMATFAAMYYMPVFWQSVYGLSPWQVGLRSISNFIGISLGSMASGIYMKRTGKYRLYSLVIYTLFVFGMFTLLLSTFYKKPFGYVDYIVMFLPGLGYATMLTVTLLALIASVDFAHQAQVTSIQYAFRATGSTFGVAVAGLVYQAGLKYRLGNAVLKNAELINKYGLDQLKVWCQEIVNDNLFDTSFDKTLHTTSVGSFMFGSQAAIGFALAMAFMGLLASLFTREHVLHTSIPSNSS
ncbi:LADA_0G09318g1_1 [Lachancea dasiensis]|uniref:LADA_0G09318g1_1 n=1 Tax=Lachancea dasiensis TaxID=1072105 RepID=A0A1G4JUD7_9SACH|nr:LADA_0G09318g1_1 [Lachancea dasiensis]